MEVEFIIGLGKLLIAIAVIALLSGIDDKLKQTTELLGKINRRQKKAAKKLENDQAVERIYFGEIIGSNRKGGELNSEDLKSVKTSVD